MTKLQTAMRAYRETHALTQARVAKKLRVHPNSISNWETGVKPRIDLRWRIARLLGVEPRELAE